MIEYKPSDLKGKASGIPLTRKVLIVCKNPGNIYTAIVEKESEYEFTIDYIDTHPLFRGTDVLRVYIGVKGSCAEQIQKDIKYLTGHKEKPKYFENPDTVLEDLDKLLLKPEILNPSPD